MIGSADTLPPGVRLSIPRFAAALAVLASLLVPFNSAAAQTDALTSPNTFSLEDDRSDDEPSMLPGEMVVHNINPAVDTSTPEIAEAVAELRAEQRLRAALQRRVAPSRTAQATSNDIAVSYANANTPNDVRAVVDAAVADWNDALVTSASGPVLIRFDWDDLSQSLPGTLGFAGPTGFLRRSDGLYYPVALANTLDRRDYRPAEAEIEVTISSSFYNRPGGWFVDATNTSVPANRLDLYATVLHEIGHGLGFLGSAEQRAGVNRIQSPPDRYDTLVRHEGSRLVDLPNSGALLTSQNLFIDIGGGLLHELYAPSQFFTGSSYSHFDEVAYPNGQPGSLMTPALGSGETERVIDAPTLGVLIQSGWQPEVGLLEPQITGLTEGSNSLAVEWEIDLTQSGVIPQSYQLEASRALDGRVDAAMSVSGTTRSASLEGLSSGTCYSLDIAAIGSGGTISSTSMTRWLDAPPAAPTLVAVSGSGFNRIISWRLDDPDQGSVTRFDVEVSTDDGPFVFLGSTSTTQFNTGSLGNNVFQFRVRAVYESGAGSYGYSLPTGFTDTVVRPHPLDGEIARLYQAYFDRLPDPGGMAFYLDGRAEGRSLESVSQEFLGSTEFVETYGSLGNRDFVEQLYRNVLGRDGDLAGIEFWTDRLDSGRSRSGVVIDFAQSPEFINQTRTATVQTSDEGSIYRLYLAYFLRPADPQGFAFYKEQVRLRSLTSISNDFALSPEFIERYCGLDDRQFLDLVYANVLSRTPDAAGYAFWLDRMQNGTSRGSVMLAFSESPEFVVRTGTTP